ncbi:hypothetical protein NC652_034094 [Populus alba x Populus x berolinensis]|nr:hypothetical protein NC652_034094 [Populus alba x Populus x berolinensis]
MADLAVATTVGLLSTGRSVMCRGVDGEEEIREDKEVADKRGERRGTTPVSVRRVAELGRWLCFFDFGRGRESLWAARRGRGRLRLSWLGLCENEAACGAGETMES